MGDDMDREAARLARRLGGKTAVLAKEVNEEITTEKQKKMEEREKEKQAKQSRVPYAFVK